jgi:MFS family permease
METTGQKMSLSDKSKGIIYGSLSVFVSMIGAAVTIPFAQAQRDNLNCDVLCYGSMQSTRSGLSLVGNVLVGRLSDKYGRITMLWVGVCASLLSYLINFNGNSVQAMWIALIPSALLNQNYSVLKALFADYNSDAGDEESTRAAALGRLGMAVGVAFMIGPVVGAQCFSSFNEATAFAILLTCIGSIFIMFLPLPKVEITRSKSFSSLLRIPSVADMYYLKWGSDNSSDNSKKNDDKSDTTTDKDVIQEKKSSFFSILSLPVAQLPGSRLLFFIRLNMGLAFHIFMTVWQVSLKTRFNFGSKDHAYFMGWIGLCYAISQGYLAQKFIKIAGEDVTIVLLLCVIGLSVGRVFVMLTNDLTLVYVIMAMVIVALGVMNTAINSACSRLADANQIGGLTGLMESVESLAGLVGPTLGGVLYRFDKNVPIVTVVLLYTLIFIAILLYFRKFILKYKQDKND